MDFQPLNAHATRETHHTRSPYHQARSVPKMMKKSVFDAWNGYHSVPLHPDDTHFTTFITPWGRYRYLTAPQGYKASGDGYSARFDGIIEGIKNKTKCVDDTLMWSEDIAQAFTDAANWLTLCGANGITLNPEKFVFAQDTVLALRLASLPSNQPGSLRRPSPNSLSLPRPLMSAHGSAW